MNKNFIVSEKKQFLFFLLIIVLGTCLCYFQILHYPFIFDDNQILTRPLRPDKLNVQTIKEIISNEEVIIKSRLVANITFALTYIYLPHKIYSYHIGNIIIHCISAILLFTFYYKIVYLFKKENKYNEIQNKSYLFIVLISSIIWTFHPVQTNAVTYTVQRMTSLSALFIIISLILYLKIRKILIENNNSYIILILLITGFVSSTLLSIGSKEIGYLIFLYLISFEIIISSRHIKKKIFIIFLIVISLLIYATNAGYIQHFILKYQVRDFTLIERLLTQPRVIVHYLSLWFIPVFDRLNLFYDFPTSNSIFYATTLPSILFFIFVIFLSYFFLKINKKLYSFLILFFIIANSLESSFIPLEMVYEHRLYIPSISLSLLSSLIIYKTFHNNKVLLIAFTSSLIILLSFFTYIRNQDWKTKTHFLNDSLKKSPLQETLLNNIAVHYYDTNKYLSYKYYTLGFANNPKDMYLAFNFLNALLKDKKIKHSNRVWNQIKKRYNTYLNLYLPSKPMSNVAINFNEVGLHQNALEIYSLFPKEKLNAKAYYAFGITFKNLGKVDKSITFLEKSWRTKDTKPIVGLELLDIYKKTKNDEKIQNILPKLQVLINEINNPVLAINTLKEYSIKFTINSNGFIRINP